MVCVPFYPTASSARLLDFPEFWLKVYLQIFAEQAGNGPVLRIFRGRCGLNPVVETNLLCQHEQTLEGKQHRRILVLLYGRKRRP